MNQIAIYPPSFPASIPHSPIGHYPVSSRVACGWFSLAARVIHGSVYVVYTCLLIHRLLSIHVFVLYVCVSISALQISSSIPFSPRSHRCALYTIFVLLVLTYFTLYESLGAPMSLRMAKFHSFQWPSNVPLSIYTASSLSAPLLMDVRLPPHAGCWTQCCGRHGCACHAAGGNAAWCSHYGEQCGASLSG